MEKPLGNVYRDVAILVKNRKLEIFTLPTQNVLAVVLAKIGYGFWGTLPFVRHNQTFFVK